MSTLENKSPPKLSMHAHFETQCTELATEDYEAVLEHLSSTKYPGTNQKKVLTVYLESMLACTEATNQL